jgi:hypothetical protein
MAAQLAMHAVSFSVGRARSHITCRDQLPLLLHLSLAVESDGGNPATTEDGDDDVMVE